MSVKKIVKLASVGVGIVSAVILAKVAVVPTIVLLLSVGAYFYAEGKLV